MNRLIISEVFEGLLELLEVAVLLIALRSAFVAPCRVNSPHDLLLVLAAALDQVLDFVGESVDDDVEQYLGRFRQRQRDVAEHVEGDGYFVASLAVERGLELA